MMKKNLIYAAIVLLLAVAGGVIFYLCRDTDEKQLRRMLDELCEIVSKSSGENHAVSGFKANRADKVFAQRCEIKFGRTLFDGTYTPTEIGANIMRFKGLFKEIDVSYSELVLAISDKRAKLFFTGRCVGVPKNNPGEKTEEIRDLNGLAQKGENGWRIIALDIVKVLEK
jgi:hypothetical protein